MTAGGCCAVCGTKAARRCAGCSEVYYCCKKHQSLHWSSHKSSCRAFKVAHNTTLGRHLVAARNIKQGETIIHEAAIVTGPKQFSDALCLGCYGELTAGVQYHQCECGFPMCRSECAASASHQAECSQMQRAASKVSVRPDDSPNPAYLAVSAGRCLLLRLTATHLWRQLELLESHDAERGSIEHVHSLDVDIWKQLQNTGFDVSLQDVHKVCGVLDVNGFDTARRGVIGLYPQAALLEHSCVPNTFRVFDDDLSIRVIASVDIPKAAHISTSYADTLWGSANRRYFLRQSKYFDCTCERCRDATELGTELSSLKCQQCSEGLVRQTDPLHPDSEWKCERCSATISSDQVNQLLETIGQYLIEMPKGCVKAAEDFVHKFSSCLSDTHFYMCDVKTALAMLYGKDDQVAEPLQQDYEMTSDEAINKQTVSSQLLAILTRLHPGMNRLRGILLYELQTAIMRRLQVQITARAIDKKHWLSEAKECVQYLQESRLQLSHEPSHSSEHALAERAYSELNALQAVLNQIADKTQLDAA